MRLRLKVSFFTTSTERVEPSGDPAVPMSSPRRYGLIVSHAIDAISPSACPDINAGSGTFAATLFT